MGIIALVIVSLAKVLVGFGIEREYKREMWRP